MNSFSHAPVYDFCKVTSVVCVLVQIIAINHNVPKFLKSILFHVQLVSIEQERVTRIHNYRFLLMRH